MDQDRKTYKGLIHSLPQNGIFVFGSNTEGRHGAGTAKIAVDKYGAKYGQARGLQGRSYGLITTNLRARIQPGVTKEAIISEIKILYAVAEQNPDLEFYVTHNNLGRNLCHYTNLQMAEMYGASNFIPSNIIFEEGFWPDVQKFYVEK